MALLDMTFSADDLPQGGSFDPIPAGWYDVSITQAEVKSTKDGSGKYIKLRLDVTGPSHEGRVLFANINIQNKSAKAEEIGRQNLGEIMRAIGLAKLTNTDQMIGGALQAKVTMKDDPQYGPGNEVKGYKALGGSAKPMPTGFNAAPAAAAQPAAKGATPPWAKK